MKELIFKKKNRHSNDSTGQALWTTRHFSSKILQKSSFLIYYVVLLFAYLKKKKQVLPFIKKETYE